MRGWGAGSFQGVGVWRLFSFKLSVAAVTDSQSFPQCGCLKPAWGHKALEVLGQKQNRRVKDWKKKKGGMAVQPGMVAYV